MPTEVEYTLYKNHLTNSADHYRGVIRRKGTLNTDDLIERMIDQGSTVTDKDAQAVFLGLKTAIKKAILEGYRVNLDLFHCGLSIKGNFADKNDEFDNTRHSLEIVVNAGAEMRKITADVRLKKQETPSKRPNPEHFFNDNNGAPDDILTPGGLGRVTGRRLSFDPTDPRQGIFLTDANGVVTQVDTYARNTARELIFLIPPGLATGEYTLEVRAVFGQHSLRSGSFEEILTVN